MTRRNDGREPWSAYDGSVYAIVVARLFEPIVRVPAAGLNYLSLPLCAVVAGSIAVNLSVIVRLRKRKRRGFLPIYFDGWYAFQLGYGVGVILLLSIVLPRGLFAGVQIRPEVWIGDLGDLFSFQLFLGCALVGLRLGFRAVLPMIVLADGLFNICTFINSGQLALGQASFWGLWAFINTAAGALGGRVLIRMMQIGYNEEELRGDKYRATLLPTSYYFKTQGVQQRLGEEWAALFTARMPELEGAVRRAERVVPEIGIIWKQLTMSGEAISIDALLAGFKENARAVGVVANVAAFGLDIEPSLTAVEQVYVQSFLHVVIANVEPPRANPDSVSVLIDVDRLWLRLRATIREVEPLAMPTDGLLHSLEMLELLTTLQRGGFAITSVQGVGEAVEARVPRSSSAY